MRRAILFAGFTGLAVVTLAGCSGQDEIALNYQLVNIDPSQVIRVETVISVDPSDTREFFADQPYRSVAPGVGYEVRDLTGSGKREVLITHDNTLGYVFAPNFTFTLLPPAGESAPPLIAIARAVSATDEIGQTMAIPVAFGTNKAYSVPIPDQRCGGSEVCSPDELCCSSACVHPLTDGANCGMCNKSCNANESCSGGACRCAGGSACDAGQTCCANGCFDTNSDAFNCGSCGHACNAGETCSGGTCHCAANGGGNACAAGDACCSTGCSALGCTCGAMACLPSQQCCGTTCSDPKSDNNHCGNCSTVCMGGLTCSAGACSCMGIACVSGDQCCTSGCAHVQDDPINCGMCGKSCQPGETCSGSSCHCGGSGGCQLGQQCCGSSCSDPKTDNANCGMCGHACRAGEICTGGTCSCAGGRACVGNETCCGQGGSTAGGGCFDLATDPSHCGSCTKSCNGGNCVMGMCTMSNCGAPCTNGNTCDPTSGMCSCHGQAACTGTDTCCSDGCQDLSSDPANCGACGRGIGPQQYCCSGTPTDRSDSNCTGCGQSCTKGVTSCCVCVPACDPLGLICNCPAT